MNLAGRFFGFVFLVFANFSVNGQLISYNRIPAYQRVFTDTDNFDSVYLQQLETGWNSTLPDTIRLSIGNDLAYYWHTRNLAVAYAWANKVWQQALTIKNSLWQARIQVTLGAILLRQEKLDTALQLLQNAQRILPRNEWPLLLTQTGYVYERRGNLDKAAEFAQQGLALGDSLKDLRTQAMAYSDLSNLFWKQSKFDKGIEYGIRAETLYKQRGIQDMDYSFTLYVIGNNYMELKDVANAQEYFNRALIISRRYAFYNNMADIYISLGDLYERTGEYEKAAAEVREAIRYSTLLDNNFILMRSWLSLGKLQNLGHIENEAILSLRTCIAVATENFGDAYFLHQVYHELGKAYSASGDFKNAYASFLTYDRLKDSVFTAAADQRIAKLQTEFEVGQKETTIKVQQQFITQQRRFQWVTLGAAGLLVFFLVALYRNYKSKQRINKTLENFNVALELKNSQLDKRNAENELLLKEIHHRVKNNLEVVSSLLELQSAQMDDPNTKDAMLESQNRVQSIGIVHQKLYQGTNLGGIEMKDYFTNLAESILDSFGQAKRVSILCMMDEIEVDIDTAVPIGLIVNELLTNTLKYAFPGGQQGKVTIKLHREPDGALHLQVSDNGVGKSGPTKGTGFGTQLIDLLTRQLNGTMHEEVQNGMHTFFVFNTGKRLVP